MDYVKVDVGDSYIYLVNDTLAWDSRMKEKEMRAHELLEKPRWYYKRIKKISQLPPGKKVRVWYNKK